MARSREVWAGVSSIPFLYQTVSDMPWERIEKVVGKPFSKIERREIHKCTDRYSWEADYVAGAAPIRELEWLHRELLVHSESICSLAERFQPKGGGRLGTDDRKVMDHLALLHNTEGNDLRDAFHQTARAAQRLIAVLDQRASMDMTTTARQPETVGLIKFLAAVLDGAVAEPARGNPGYDQSASAKEYSRWGLSIGPRCKGFPAFVSCVLDQDITEDKLRNIWPEARREAEHLAALFDAQKKKKLP